MAATAQDASAPLRGPEKKDEDREEDTEYSPFYGIEKGAVLQEARCFNDPHIDPRRCQQVITKLLYLICQGESLTKKEATDVFFSVTKLYQSKDANLRRMVYLVIKEVCPSSDEVIIITSSLMKDMNSKTELYRSNAIRVLCSITDSQLLLQIERYLKQAVVDKSAVVASAVLTSAMHLLSNNTDLVKRWTNEIQEAVQSKSPTVQFHAVALLHALRSNDRLAVAKLVTSLTRSSGLSPGGAVRSPLAQCLLVRYVAQVIRESGATTNGGEPRPFFDFLESSLRHKSESVIFEAARAICNLKDVSTRELTPAITLLQLFLSNNKPVVRFAAVRTLNKVAMTHPMAVTNCNIDMEALISDHNRSIATLAITTLLKTGNESSVERLIKQIGAFMSDIADDFKIVVVEAVQALCLKFPQKHRALMAFLSNVLREDGGFEYKKAIVDAILILIKEIPEAKDAGLAHLCEFIEDCEFSYLASQILHLLGAEGPHTSDPAKYIRFIYNRVILENATVRAAAVSSLASFGMTCDFLKPRVITLLQRALFDNDDEVRDRATLHLAELQAVIPKDTSPWLLAPRNLEASLQAYLANGSDQPFDLASVPAAPSPKPKKEKDKHKTSNLPSPRAAAAPSEYAAQLAAVPQLSSLGQLFRSSLVALLTEEETEYTVTLVKHIFPAHVVLQFNCTNTVAEQMLENVSIVVDLAEAEDFEQGPVIPLPQMAFKEPGQAYTVLQRAPGTLAGGKLQAVLHFKVKEIDPSTGEPEEEGYEDEYQLEDVDIGPADYITPTSIGNWRYAWEELGEQTEVADEYGLGARDSLQDTVEAVIGTLGMKASEGTDAVPPNARSHTALLAGEFPGNVQALVKLSFGIDAARQVAMKVVVRAADNAVADAVHRIIQDG